MPTLDNKASSNTGGSSVSTDQTIPFTVGSGTNRYIGVSVMLVAAEPKDITAMKYHGLDLTKRKDVLHTTENFLREQYWDLVAPDSGANNLVITPSTSERIAWTIRSYTDVDPTTPRGTIVNAEGTTNAPSVNASSTSGELVIDGTAPSGTVVFTEGAGQVNISKIETTDCIASSEEAGAASVTMSWTMDSPQPWLSIAVPLKPATTKPSGPFPTFRPDLP